MKYQTTLSDLQNRQNHHMEHDERYENIKGHSTCKQQVTSAENDGSASLRYNTSNAWYVNTNNGNLNNNNTYNRCLLVPAPDLLFSELLKAEQDCFKNKHYSIEACRVHYHLAKLYFYTKQIYVKGFSVGKSKCFVLDYPVPREIFCANYLDRIVHHMIAPYISKISEKVHTKNGNVSHGNRKSHSAYTAAVDIQNKLREITNNWTQKAWVATIDYSGFFMSIPREKAVEEFNKYASEDYDSFLSEIVELYVTSNPTKNCERLSPESSWDKVAFNKSLFTAEEGCGLPIGNFPSQLMANLYRAGVDAKLSQLENVKQVVFVDDRMLCSTDKEALKEAFRINKIESEKYGLKVNPRKCYIQQADKGVKFCGYVIKCDRIYISNRVVNACKYLAKQTAKTPQEELLLMQRINSYFGLMAHTRSYNIQKQIAKEVLKNNKNLYFKKKGNQLICLQKESNIQRSIKSIQSFKNQVNEIRKNGQRRNVVSRM